MILAPAPPLSASLSAMTDSRDRDRQALNISMTLTATQSIPLAVTPHRHGMVTQARCGCCRCLPDKLTWLCPSVLSRTSLHCRREAARVARTRQMRSPAPKVRDMRWRTPACQKKNNDELSLLSKRSSRPNSNPSEN